MTESRGGVEPRSGQLVERYNLWPKNQLQVRLNKLIYTRNTVLINDDDTDMIFIACSHSGDRMDRWRAAKVVPKILLIAG